VENEATRVGFLALALVLAMGCTTTVINLAVGDGGTEKVSVPGQGADGAGPPDVTLAVDEGLDKVSVPGQGADGASPPDFEEAFDAGTIPGPGRYVLFTCCVLTDTSTCTDGRLGGPGVCYDAAEWKSRAYDQCTALGSTFTLTDYRLFGTCSPANAP